MQNQQPEAEATTTSGESEVNKQQQLTDDEELLLGPIESLKRLEIERHRTPTGEKPKHGNPFRLNSRTLVRRSQQRRRTVPRLTTFCERPSLTGRRRCLSENSKKGSIIREAVLTLCSAEPTCLSDNSASALLEEACKLSISNKAKTFGHGSVIKDFKSLNINSTDRADRVAKDDANLSEPYASNSFQRARSNTMPSNFKRPPTTEGTSSSNGHTCSVQARISPPSCDVTIDELASYFEEFVHIPRKMSHMAEMMYI